MVPHQRRTTWLAAVALGLLAGGLIGVPVTLWLAWMGDQAPSDDQGGTAVVIGYGIWVVVGATVSAYVIRRGARG